MPLASVAGFDPATVVDPDAVLDRLADLRGLPDSITVDHGPEFEGQILDVWACQNGVVLNFILPGKPVENAYIESFNGRFRDECLSEHWFLNMKQARGIIERCRITYNTARPHSSLGDLTPEEYVRNCLPSELLPLFGRETAPGVKTLTERKQRADR